ncbi:unnamed protein product [Sympodiomycopsis kandeliae]
MHVKLTHFVLATLAVGSAYADVGQWYFTKECSAPGVSFTTQDGKLSFTNGIQAIRTNAGIKGTIYSHTGCTGKGNPANPQSCTSFSDALIYCFKQG